MAKMVYGQKFKSCTISRLILNTKNRIAKFLQMLMRNINASILFQEWFWMMKLLNDMEKENGFI